jgi:formylglycine-generating enzyme required for sulfatase activity
MSCKKYRSSISILVIVLLTIHLHVATSYATEKKAGKDCSCHNIPNRFSALTKKTDHYSGMAQIPGGTYMMGGDNDQAKEDEFPKHKITISKFWMDKTQVTNAQFQKFVDATKYVTTAENKPDWEELKKQLPPDTPKPDEKLLVPASLVFTQLDHPVLLDNPAQWRSWTPGANWHHPRGANSHIEGLNHPGLPELPWKEIRCNNSLKWTSV